MKTPKELMEYVSHSAEKRLTKTNLQIIVSAILAGMFIAFGSVGNIITSADLISTNAGVAKFVGASVFPVGLITIVVLGLELFTSNCMVSLPLVQKRVDFKKALKVLAIIWLFNLVGGLIIAFISYKTHTLSDAGVSLLASIAEHKVHTGAIDLILKGIMCNVLVCGASLLGYISKDGISKIFGVWFLIMLFIVLGYDHVVANMLYLPLAYFHGAEGVTILNIAYNFFFVTIGNFLGGSIIALSVAFISKTKEDK